MAKLLEFLKGKKTYLIVFGGILTVWLNAWADDGVLTLEERRQCITATLELLGLGGLRAGVGKVNNDVTKVNKKL